MPDKIYSNSKLELFERCPEAYKAKYIDKTYPEIPKNMSLFLGEMVHSSLEWIYSRIIDGENVDLDKLIENFIANWDRSFSPEIRLKNGEKPADYFNKGVKYLIDYYKRHSPFSENTLFVEKKILFSIDDYKIQGYLDRLVLNKDGGYEVHDYKTSAYMKSQKEVDKDRQLSFYQLGLHELFGKEIKVKLIWHFLAYDEMVLSSRTDEQLEDIKNETLHLIKIIESNAEWPACGKPWCDWCAYKSNLLLKGGNFLLDRYLKKISYV